MKDFFRNNGGLILIIAVLLGCIIALTSALMGGFAHPLSNLVGIITTPVRNGINAVVEWTEARYEAAFRQSELEADYEQLKKDYAQLEKELREAQSDAEENERLPETADNLARLDRSGRAERFEDVERRVRSFLSEIGDAALAAGGGNVLAATHAFTIRTLMYLLDPTRINDPLVIANGSLTRVDYDGERFILRETGALEPRL